MDYNFDRFFSQKISQAYRILVPEKVWFTDKESEQLTEKVDIECEDGSHLRTGIIGQTKRRANHRYPDGSP